jgi:hypothetical protein
MMMTAITSFCFIVEVWSDCPALGESGYLVVLWWWERPGWLKFWLRSREGAWARRWAVELGAVGAGMRREGV